MLRKKYIEEKLTLLMQFLKYSEILKATLKLYTQLE